MTSREAVENTVKKVVDEVLQELKADLSNGYTQALEILSSVKREANSEAVRTVEASLRQAEVLRRQILGTAEMAARNKSLELLEENVSNAFYASINKIKESPPPQSEYEEVLTRLLEESVELMGTEEVVVQGNARDLSLIRKVAGKMGERYLRVSVASDPIECVGGLKIMTVDGSIMYDNTFEGRLERLKPMLRREVANLFMGG